MYKSRIRAWGLDKKNKSHEVQAILQQLNTRKSLGKESAFVLRGRAVDMADIERYAKRKGLLPARGNAAQTEQETIPDLVCYTPPPTLLHLEPPTSLQNIDSYLYLYNSFIGQSLKSGEWTLSKTVSGIAFLQGSEYPRSARDGFCLSIERGVSRYRWDDCTQAYRQWRRAFSQLQSTVNCFNPSQLICTIEAIAYLAEYESEVAGLLLRYLRFLVGKDRICPDARLATLQGLSRLETHDLGQIAKISQQCALKLFRTHFSCRTIFLVESETALGDETAQIENEASIASLQCNNLDGSGDVYDTGAIRATRSIIELFMAFHQYTRAERLASSHILRLKQMPHNRSTAGALSHAYSCLVHIYLSQKDYKKAYETMVVRVDNYIEMLVYGTEVPEDSPLLAYSALESVAKILGRRDDAIRWNREYNILKARSELLPEVVDTAAKVTAVETLKSPRIVRHSDGAQLISFPASTALQASSTHVNIEDSPDRRPCGGPILDDDKDEDIGNGGKTTYQPAEAWRSSMTFKSGSSYSWSVPERLPCCSIFEVDSR